MSETQPKIFLDTREQTHKLTQYLQTKYDVQFMALGAGDILIPKEQGFILIEKTTITDLLGKSNNSTGFQSRIWNQIEKMKELTDDYYILLEDLWRLKFTKYPRAAALGLVSAVTTQCRVYQSSNVGDSAAFISYLVKHYGVNKSVDSHQVRVKPRGMTIDQQAKFVLAGIDGVGAKTAEKLLTQYGSIQLIACADVDALKGIVGEKLAERILDVLQYKF